MPLLDWPSNSSLSLPSSVFVPVLSAGSVGKVCLHSHLNFPHLLGSWVGTWLFLGSMAWKVVASIAPETQSVWGAMNLCGSPTHSKEQDGKYPTAF